MNFTSVLLPIFPTTRRSITYTNGQNVYKEITLELCLFHIWKTLLAQIKFSRLYITACARCENFENRTNECRSRRVVVACTNRVFCAVSGNVLTKKKRKKNKWIPYACNNVTGKRNRWNKQSVNCYWNNDPRTDLRIVKIAICFFLLRDFAINWHTTADGVYRIARRKIFFSRRFFNGNKWGGKKRPA